MRLRQLLHEPLLHFLLIGIALFVVYGRVAAPDKSSTRIVVSQAMIDEMAREYQALWNRAPSDQELTGLIDHHVRDEILYREGLALGLDRDDPVVKRRLRQKLEVMAEEQDARNAPTDADLSAYLTQNAARFERPATLSFDQIFFDTSATRAVIERALAAARSAPKRGAPPVKLGQPSMLPSHVQDASVDQVDRDFGAGFAQQLMKLPLGEWTESVSSGFGSHLVRVIALSPAVLPPLAEIRQQVTREWENERRTKSRDDGYQKLRGRYGVVVDAKRPSHSATQ